MFHIRHSQTKTPQVIAVCGTSHGCGTTHFALALANFLCNKQNQTAAYVEYNATREISALSLGKNEKNHFPVKAIDLYPEVTSGSLPEILRNHYSYFILDMGVLNTNTYPEFLRCGYHFVIGSIAPWKLAEYDAFLKTFYSKKTISQESITFLGNLGIKENQKFFLHRFRLPVHLVPFFPNPFQLTPEDWLFFKEILELSDIPQMIRKPMKIPHKLYQDGW